MVIQARAPGKVILSGEHAVVHGSTAVAASIDLYTNILLEHDTSVIDRDLLQLRTCDDNIVFSWTLKSIRNALSDSIIPNPLSNEPILDKDIEIITLLVKEQSSSETKIGLTSGMTAFLWLYTSILGYRPASVIIKSDLPLGSGLGSSASLCVSLSAALLASSGVLKIKADHHGWISPEPSDFELINRWAFEGEKIIHGQPSGIDNTVSTYGKMITYKAGDVDHINSSFPLRMLITNTNVERNTKLLVAKVFEKSGNYPDAMGGVFLAIDSIGVELSKIIVSNNLPILEKEKKIQELMEMNQGLLQCMGVSHASIETVLRTTRKYNLTSKLTGAGGGGCVLTFLPTVLSSGLLEEMTEELKKHGFECIDAIIGGKGLEIRLDVQQ